jgi:pyrroline-5-carboxylate reductase
MLEQVSVLQQNISFIGYGNIAKAFVKGLSSYSHYHLRAASPSLSVGVDAYGVTTSPDNLAMLDGVDLLILAVKPVKIAEVLTEIKSRIPPTALVISIVAGVSLSYLEQACLNDQAIVRAMPNIAMAVGQGATPLFANAFVTEKQKTMATALFQSFGESAWVENEDEIDLLTALSGSGPAYLFLFLDAMATACEKLGLSKEIAKKFTLQTMMGAAVLAKESGLELSKLREKVTSKGGTTAAAIEVFETHDLKTTVLHAIKAAYQRAKDLGFSHPST